MNAKIKAVSYYLPERIITNEYLASISSPPVTPESIFKKTGIRERRMLEPRAVPSEIALTAFHKFHQEHPEINKEEIDFLLYCSEGTDYRSPCTAGILQNKIGLKTTCGGLDIGLSCSGYTYGLLLAKSLIECGHCRNVLFIVQAVPTTVIHESNIELRALFGDAVGITLITATGDPGIGKFVTGMDGTGENSLRVVRSSLNDPLDAEWFGEMNQNCYLPFGRMEMNGIDIFNFSLRVVPPLIAETLEKNNCTKEDIDWFVFHQANVLMLKSLRRKLSIPEEKFIIQMEKTGNTVSASIPICLTDMINTGTAKKGDKILLAGFGAGFSWSATVMTL